MFAMSATPLVLAAGMGSRYGGPRQIDPVGPSGEVVLDYSVHDAMKAGFDRGDRAPVASAIAHMVEAGGYPTFLWKTLK